jgi:hypothetical protein
MSKKDRRVRLINSYFLWLSMCAVFPNRKKVAGITDYKQLLGKYLVKQIKKKRFNYVEFCKENNEVAYRTAKSVLELRSQTHDFNYYDLVD